MSVARSACSRELCHFDPGCKQTGLRTKSGSVPQQKFRFLTVAARFSCVRIDFIVHRKPSRDRQEAEQLYWQGLCFFPEALDPSDKLRKVGVNPRLCSQRCVEEGAACCRDECHFDPGCKQTGLHLLSLLPILTLTRSTSS